jgi:hypothetical protein
MILQFWTRCARRYRLWGTQNSLSLHRALEVNIGRSGTTQSLLRAVIRLRLTTKNCLNYFNMIFLTAA